jgi:hypothetical protein
MRVRLGLVVLSVLGFWLSVMPAASASLPYELPGSLIPSGGTVHGSVRFNPKHPPETLTGGLLTFTGHLGSPPNVNFYGAADYTGSFSMTLGSSAYFTDCSPTCGFSRHWAFSPVAVSGTSGHHALDGYCLTSAFARLITLELDAGCFIRIDGGPELLYILQATAPYLRAGARFNGVWMEQL